MLIDKLFVESLWHDETRLTAYNIKLLYQVCISDGMQASHGFIGPPNKRSIFPIDGLEDSHQALCKPLDAGRGVILELFPRPVSRRGSWRRTPSPSATTETDNLLLCGMDRVWLARWWSGFDGDGPGIANFELAD